MQVFEAMLPHQFSTHDSQVALSRFMYVPEKNTFWNRPTISEMMKCNQSLIVKTDVATMLHLGYLADTRIDHKE